MMFDDRSSKFEKEQKKMREIARQKRETEQRLKVAHELREKEMHELAERRRVEREEQQRIIDEKIADELRITGGIKFFHTLSPYEIEGEDDKVILPESCLHELSQQDVFGKGPVAFQIVSSSSGSPDRTTHCGVREFTAPEGSIGLPKKVIDSLLTKDGDTIAHIVKVTIKYVTMPKCTFVKLQPKHNRFFDVGPVKMCLEENLRLHATLTVGDQLTVWYRGAAHVLVVTELRPEGCHAASLFDTDVEVDLELSQEYLAHQSSASSGSNSSNSSSSSTTSSGSIGGRSSGSVAGSSLAVGTDAKAAASPMITSSVFSGTGSSQARTLNEAAPVVTTLLNYNNTTTATAQNSSTDSTYLSLLQPEPADSSSDATIRVKVKLTNGKSVMRRFLVDAPVAQLFYYIGSELQLSSDQLPGVLVTSQVLRRSFLMPDTAGQSLRDVGLVDSSVSLMMSISST